MSSSPSDNSNNTDVARTDERSSVVVRSVVPTGKLYSEYKPYLRLDFSYSCAYCKMSEAEAQAIRFTIDHYEPRNARPDLEHDYGNLMYACDECNRRKGDRCPPAAARADGHRFFRADVESYEDHFERSGRRVEGKSNTGVYTVDAIDLNRLALRRLRELRERLVQCDRFVLEGLASLRHFHIDQLPPEIRAKALRTIGKAADLDEKLAKDIDDLLREAAKSPLVDEDEEAQQRAIDRAARLKALEGLYPGKWRAPRAKSGKKST